ncbi:MAG: hypothetical protein P9M12_06890 [Candidatus Aceula lacicola]|nr:hypothetical protein [Candidatus Aceula lacicola]
MGITYKLKKEVVDYILLQKRTSPRLGCRKISDLASQFFQKEISKSSVNSILKTFLLSSPVGRRAAVGKKQEKFKIPEYRKKELFVNVPKELLVDEPVVVQQEKKGNLFKGAGAVILKAAELQVAQKGFVSSFVEEFSQSQLIESLLYSPVLGVSNQDELMREEGLWKINGVGSQPSGQEIQKAMIGLEELENKKQEIGLKSFEMFSEVKYFKLFLKNGDHFCIDAQFNSVWTKENVHSRFSLPLEKSLDFLSKRIISNIRPIVLRCSPGVESFPSYFYTMLACFEGFSSQSVVKIDLLAEHDEVLSSFETILHKKRQFIVLLPNSHALFTQALSKKGSTLEGTFKFVGQNILYSQADLVVEHSLLDKEVALRAFILKIEGQEPFVLITNISNQAQNAEQIINQYLEQWPHAIKGYQDFMMMKEEPASTICLKELSLDEEMDSDKKPLFLNKKNLFVNNFLTCMHQYCQKHFFPSSCHHLSFQEAQKIFYNLFGVIDNEDGVFKVSLVLPERYSHGKQLEYILRRVNESVACLNQENRIFCVSP